MIVEISNMTTKVVLFALVSILLFGTTILQSSIAQTQASCGIQTGGIIHTQLDRQQYCVGSADGQNAASKDFQQHAKFNDSPPIQSQGLNHTAAYNEGYKNSYDDEWIILLKG